jgi:hypothetical protein
LNKFGLAPDANVDLNLLMLKKSFAIFNDFFSGVIKTAVASA